MMAMGKIGRMLSRLVPFANFKAKSSACPVGRDLCFSIAVSMASRMRFSLWYKNLSPTCRLLSCC
jgi:hypothetical protein